MPDARPFIERLDVLVNASDPEPFGIVLLEGMAAAVPVLAVDAGGPAEIVQHEKTGMLARSGEPEALADALEPLLSSSELRRTLGEAGRDRFLREYSDVAMRKRFFGALEQLAADRGSSMSVKAEGDGHTPCAATRRERDVRRSPRRQRRWHGARSHASSRWACDAGAIE